MITGSGRGVKLQARVFKESWKVKTNHEIVNQTSTYYLFMEPLIDFMYELFSMMNIMRYCPSKCRTVYLGISAVNDPANIYTGRSVSVCTMN